jgi:hypothetical protein
MTAPAPGTTPGATNPGGTPTGQAPEGIPQPTGQQQPPAPGAPEQPPAETQDETALPPWAQKELKRARGDAGKYRTEAQTATQAAAAAKAKQDAVLKALGLKPDGSDEPLTQEQLDARIAEAADEVWTTKVENLVLRTSGVDADALWDSRAFVRSLDPFSDMDPRTPEFAKDVAAHIAKYVTDHPQFKAKTEDPPGAARSGGDHPGGAGKPTTRPTSLGAAVASEYEKRRRGGK